MILKQLKRVMLLLVSSLLMIKYVSTVDLTVTTSVGNVTGSTQSVAVGPETRQIAAYLGIPYAEPPVGDLRFAKPVPKAAFNDTFLAKSFGSACPQTSTFAFQKPILNQDEDCLYLNVFSPRLTGSGPKYPVMIWIHGGSFLFGSGWERSSDILAAFGQVVVVSINYRLGPFGFLDSGDVSSTGNFALWDQHLAIQWVKNNIEAFGGDVTRITVFGGSAGASCVMYQTMYPGNENMFQRAITQSGSVNAAWTVVQDSAKTFNAYAARLNCSRGTSGEILSCLRSVKDVKVMMEKSIMTYMTGGTDWAPTIDNDFVTQERLDALNHPIGKNRLNHFQKLDLLMGTNGFEGEGSVVFSPFFQSVFMNESTSVDDVRKAVRETLYPGIVTLFGAELAKKVFPDIHFLYDNLEDPLDKNRYVKNLGDAFMDEKYFVPTYSALENHAINNNQSVTYQYEFNELSPFMKRSPWVTGSIHADDLKYILGSVYQESVNLTQPSRDAQWLLSKKIMTYWTNFAKSGNPNKPATVNVTWEKYDVTKKQYLYLTSAEISIKNNLYRRRAEFWTSYLPSLIKRYSEKDTVVITNPCTNSAAVTKSYVLIFVALSMLLLSTLNRV